MEDISNLIKIKYKQRQDHIIKANFLDVQKSLGIHKAKKDYTKKNQNKYLVNQYLHYLIFQ